MVLPGMSDGRVFTSYKPNCESNEHMKKIYNIKNNNEYRMFLQKNAEKLLLEMHDLSFKESQEECMHCWNTKDNM